MSPAVVVVVSVALVASSAFFVAVEFAVIAAKKHRLADAAAGSRSARAALRSASELTVLLAGSQLGITVCTLALGAITKPAVHHWLTPVFVSWGLASWVADAVAFVLALIVVTFVHLVVGEMAPKSWAIAHPERSAIMLALPMRAFMALTRPTLRLLNAAANWCLRRVGVEPSDEVSMGQDVEALRHLVEHSGDVGTLDADRSAAITTVLDLDAASVGELAVAPTSVGHDATVADVRRAAQTSGHLRIVVFDGTAGPGVVHVRDTLGHPSGDRVADFVRPALQLDERTTLHDALLRMQGAGAQLAVVTDTEGKVGDGTAVIGVVTITDVVNRLLLAPAAHV